MKRKAFITGITGQDGSYLAEILLERDYEVYGMVRRASTFNRSRIDHLFGQIERLTIVPAGDCARRVRSHHGRISLYPRTMKSGLDQAALAAMGFAFTG